MRLACGLAADRRAVGLLRIVLVCTRSGGMYDLRYTVQRWERCWAVALALLVAPFLLFLFVEITSPAVRNPPDQLESHPIFWV